MKISIKIIKGITMGIAVNSMNFLNMKPIKNNGQEYRQIFKLSGTLRLGAKN